MYNLSRESIEMLKILGTQEIIKNEIEEAISNSINYSSLKTITINYLESEEKTTIKKSDISLYKVEQIGNSLYLRFMDIESKWQSIDIKYIETIKDGRKNTLWSYKQLPNTEIKQIIPNKKISNTNFDSYYIVIVNSQVQGEYKGIGIKGDYVEFLYIPNDFTEVKEENTEDKNMNTTIYKIDDKQRYYDLLKEKGLTEDKIKEFFTINGVDTYLKVNVIINQYKSYYNYKVIDLKTEKERNNFNSYEKGLINLCLNHYEEPKENKTELEKYHITIEEVKENISNNLNFIDLNSTHKQLITIEGNKAIIKHLIGSTIWKTNTRDIINDFGHKDVKSYIKHLKKFGYKEIKDISMYTEDNKMTNLEDPQIEKWNNKLNTAEKINHQLEILKRVVLRRKKESPNLELITCNGYIISKILQAQGFKCQFKRPQYDKCYYDIKNSNNDFISVIFKDIQGNKEYYIINCSIENNIKQNII